MAYKIIVTAYFEETAAKTSQWLEDKWSAQSADKFDQKLKSAIERISKRPFTGRLSNNRKNIRSVPVTRHNRIYYSISNDTITLLELFETKQDPERNKFEQ